MNRIFRRAPWSGLAAAALVAAALVGPGQARAAAGCRADPIVTLSNGVTLDLHVSINDTVGDVKQVKYVLHGPPLGGNLPLPSGAVAVPNGTGNPGWYTLTYPTSTDGAADVSPSLSTFTYVADDSAGNYDGDIWVTTGAASVTMTAYMDWVSGSGTPTPTAPAQGHNGQELHIHLHVA